MHFRSLLYLFFLLILCTPHTQAQYIQLNNDVNNRIEGALSHTHSRFHSDVKPFLQRDVDSILNLDSVLYPEIHTVFSHSLLGRKLLNEHFLQLSRPGFAFTLDPIFNFEMGRDFSGSRNAWVNTRGAAFSGTIGKYFSFETRFFENQATFIAPIQSLIGQIGVIPGQGTSKGFKTNGYDYFMSEAYISYSPSRYFNFQLGQGKNFIGDGYRSLLLSDAAFSYPYFKITADVWILKYTCTYAQFQDLKVPRTPNMPGDQLHARKYGTFHYLSAAITPAFTLGLFESVIFASNDTVSNRGYEIAYLNPVIFLRPIEESIGSPDNALMGVNGSLKTGHSLTLYSQFLLDEFKLIHMRKRDGWNGNKMAFQIGAKGYDIFHINGLAYRAEFNVARPYTYSHGSSLQNYGHYNQPLAHPQGANFREMLAIITYNPHRWTLSAKLLASTFGADTSNINFGGDIFKSYLTAPNELGNIVTQGLKTNLFIGEARCSYLLNPRTHMMLEAVMSYRKLSNTKSDQSSLYFGVAFKTSVSNLYYDFQ